MNLSERQSKSWAQEILVFSLVNISVFTAYESVFTAYESEKDGRVLNYLNFKVYAIERNENWNEKFVTFAKEI